jgi:hypothetical protein
MMIEIPLPKPRSVICSPSHIRNIVPVTSVDTGDEPEHHARIKNQPLLRLEERLQSPNPETAQAPTFRNVCS